LYFVVYLNDTHRQSICQDTIFKTIPSQIPRKIERRRALERVDTCSSWGSSRDEALSNMKDAAEIFIQDMLEVIDEPAVSVSL